jgi:succinate dehydrogenase/fumarate reductase cytochrome b subunit
MNVTLLKSVVAFVPVSMLLAGSLVLVLKGRTLYASIQLLGAAFLAVVVLSHICEALRLFPVMEWGMERSPGHYLDFCSALLGFTLFPLGYLLHALRTEQS